MRICNLIEFHSTNKKLEALEDLESHYQKYMVSTLEKVVAGEEKLLRGLASLSLEWAHYCNILHKREVIDALSLHGDVVAAMFQMAQARDGTVTTVKLGRNSTKLPATISESYINVGMWEDGFLSAACSRNRAALDILCEVDPKLYRRSTTKGEAFQYEFAEFLSCLYRSDNNAGQKILQTLEQADPDKCRFIAEEDLFDLHIPRIELAFRLLEKNPVEFNKAMNKALLLFKKYWGQSELSHVYVGYLATGILAIACIANDNGISVNIDSDYAPMWIINKDITPS